MAAALPLIDAHNHLQDERLAPYRGAILRELESPRIAIARAVVNGTTEADWPAVAALAREHPWVLPSYGLHPWYLKTRSAKWRERLLAYVEQGGCGIGEIGLDRWIGDPRFEDQKEVFSWQLRLAAERNLPVTIHCLKAWGALWEIVRKEAVPECGFLLHAYGGPPEMVDGFVRRGAYFSFSGYFLHERKGASRETFRQIPAHRLLVETDAPAMPLPPERTRYPLPSAPEGSEGGGDRPVNHPANIASVYLGLAELRAWDEETCAAQIAENFYRLFGKNGATE